MTALGAARGGSMGALWETYKPRVLKTSLSNEDEAKLKAALSKVA